MSITRKTDVKNHLSARWRGQNRPYLAVSQPDATGFSGTDQDAIKVQPSAFIEDFDGERSRRGISLVPADLSINTTGIQVPEVSRSPQE